MRLIIDIDEEDYKIMKHNVAVDNPLCPIGQREMVTKIANGIPLQGENDRRQSLIDLLKDMPIQTLQIAYLYAKNYSEYGEDVTKTWTTATENSSALEKAYRKGYYDAWKAVEE